MRRRDHRRRRHCRPAAHRQVLCSVRRPLPETVERLRAFKTASTAIHGSLLMAALLHQEDVRARLKHGTLPPQQPTRRAGSDKALLRRSTTEGVGMLQPSEDFNVVREAFKVSPPPPPPLAARRAPLPPLYPVELASALARYAIAIACASERARQRAGARRWLIIGGAA